MYCIETQNLSHRFPGGDRVLNNINIQVPVGSIYGFLGPNGAGKTTTLRLVLGLLKRQEGAIRIFDKPFEAHRLDILKKTGSLIESPSIYAHLTAAENLAVLQRVYRCPKSRIAEVLNIVGLQNTGKKKAGKFSLGMKQRLSIAIALLHSPTLLILDEPTNGLDPNGIIEIRELLKSLNRELGITIVISSHLLAEIEKLATHTGIIHRGNMLFQGTLKELQLRQAGSTTSFSTNDNIRAQQLIQGHGIHPSVVDGHVLVPTVEKEAIAKLNANLVEQGISVYGINAISNDLESIFIDLVKN